MQTVLSPALRLSVELRERTQYAHVAAEAAFDLNARLADLETYGELLIVLRGFHGQAEEALGAVEGWDRLTPQIDIGSRRRAKRIDDDLGQLGINGPTSWPALPFAPVIDTLARGLGCLYVLEGSTLGGQIVAHRARAAFGEHLPTAFFAGARPGEVRVKWRALQAALDTFGAMQDDPGVAEETVMAARETFAALTSRLNGQSVSK